MKVIRKILMFFLHHFVRVFWANFVGACYTLGYLFQWKKLKEKYVSNKGKWQDVKGLDQLSVWFRSVYSYKWDGWRGVFDHNNFPLEFFSEFGDCEDVAYYAAKKLRQIKSNKVLSSHKEIEFARMYGFSDLFHGFWHYDCVYKYKDDSNYYLFAYGRNYRCSSLKEVPRVMQELYTKSYKLKSVICWRCLWR